MAYKIELNNKIFTSKDAVAASTGLVGILLFDIDKCRAVHRHQYTLAMLGD